MKTKCSKKLPGVFMSDGQRNCYKAAKVKIDGKCYCLQHARMYVKKKVAAFRSIADAAAWAKVSVWVLRKAMLSGAVKAGHRWRAE